MIAVWEFMVGLVIGLPVSIWLLRMRALWLMVLATDILFGCLFTVGIGLFYLSFMRRKQGQVKDAYLKAAHGS